jgi:hypothetical protein
VVKTREAAKNEIEDDVHGHGNLKNNVHPLKTEQL